ncbi:UNVERIFIED_CONTAM: hypothetical protein HDU68_000738 [Siphonaria sp. JEL0065]|nr:hypothetical protein HDU68_000738 [Siphonaria sp. JEL0065]
MPRVEVQRRSRAHNKPTHTTKSVKPSTSVSFAGLAHAAAATVPKPVPTSTKPEQDPEEVDGLGKKEKRVQRREKWLEKLSGVYSARSIADKKKKKKQLFGVAADLEDIQAALAEDDLVAPELVNEQQRPKQATAQKKKPVSQKARTKEGIQEMLRLQSVMGHKSFKSNPLATIRTHLKNTIE